MMKNCESLLAYSTIVAAVHGESEAIQKVVKYYESYISTLATRTMFDAYGDPRICVDISLKHRLESKLLARIGAFDLSKTK